MSMLAEPRRKQKVINLRAKNNAWSNDANKFGQRMLEKMGWSSGKGLGANENGIVEHVVARYKNDEKGLGFQDKNDQWTKHEDDFNMLLANLSNDGSSAEKLHSGISLEVKSKKSKARVHYHKFTRGKDLTRYSEKDLANIFGKKSLKNEKKCEELLKDEEVVQTTEQIFTEKGSMEDYFKNKLASFKMKNNNVQVLSTNEADNSVDYTFQGFPKNIEDEAAEVTHPGFGFQLFSVDNNQNSKLNQENDIVSCDTQNCDPVPISIKKRNKKSKVKVLIENSISDISEPVTKKKEKKKTNTLVIENLIVNSIPLNCNEKNTHLDDCIKLNDLLNELEGPTQELLKVKKSKKKIKTVQEVSIEDVQNTMEDTIPLDSKKEKSRKNKRHLDVCIELHDLEETTQEMVKVKKSKKKNKGVQEYNLEGTLENDTEIDNYLPKKKKRKNKEKQLGNQ